MLKSYKSLSIWLAVSLVAGAALAIVVSQVR